MITVCEIKLAKNEHSCTTTTTTISTTASRPTAITMGYCYGDNDSNNNSSKIYFYH